MTEEIEGLYHEVRFPWLQVKILHFLRVHTLDEFLAEMTGILHFCADETLNIWNNKDEHAQNAQFAVFFESVQLLMKIKKLRYKTVFSLLKNQRFFSVCQICKHFQ